ncbi:MAG: MBL fold metallo-hydrolase [Bacteroidales bacterium]|nr:MBL fold metallo-hydrolase [Bacteroidales bacterium]
MKLLFQRILLINISLFGFFIIHCQNTSSWFTVKEVANKVWVIDDHKAANIYLVEGGDSALLVDTGIGIANLQAQAKRLTDKPLIVVNTHAHPDHSGANYQFEKVYIHALDSTQARMYNQPDQRKGILNMGQQDNSLSAEDLYNSKVHNTKLIPVNEGYVFDLGGRQIQVIEVPGHTPGSISLLDIQNKLLFSGDNNNNLVWLFLDVCLPLSVYKQSVEKEAQRLKEYNLILPGHNEPMSSDFILDQLECLTRILNGTCESKPYKSFAGDAQICAFGRSQVAYNPENL